MEWSRLAGRETVPIKQELFEAMVDRIQVSGIRWGWVIVALVPQFWGGQLWMVLGCNVCNRDVTAPPLGM